MQLECTLHKSLKPVNEEIKQRFVLGEIPSLTMGFIFMGLGGITSLLQRNLRFTIVATAHEEQGLASLLLKAYFRVSFW
jgi:hypothetical protein